MEIKAQENKKHYLIKITPWQNKMIINLSTKIMKQYLLGEFELHQPLIIFDTNQHITAPKKSMMLHAEHMAIHPTTTRA